MQSDDFPTKNPSNKFCHHRSNTDIQYFSYVTDNMHLQDTNIHRRNQGPEPVILGENYDQNKPVGGEKRCGDSFGCHRLRHIN